MIADPRTLTPFGILVLALATASVSRADDVELPLTASVLGDEVRTENKREMQGEIVTRLFDAYAEEKGISVTEAELDAFIAALDRVAAKDRADRKARIATLERNLAADDLDAEDRQRIERSKALEEEVLASLEQEPDLTPEESEQVTVMRQGMAQAMIRQRKINRELFDTYGGRVIY